MNGLINKRNLKLLECWHIWKAEKTYTALAYPKKRNKCSFWKLHSMKDTDDDCDNNTCINHYNMLGLSLYLENGHSNLDTFYVFV